MTENRPLLDTLADMTAASVSRADLAAREVMLVRVAGLVAVDAPPASYLLNLGPAADSGLTLEDARSVLVTLAPIVGGPGVVDASAKHRLRPRTRSGHRGRGRGRRRLRHHAIKEDRQRRSGHARHGHVRRIRRDVRTHWMPLRPTTTPSSRCTTTSTSSTPLMPRSSARTTKARSRSSRSTSSRCARVPGSVADSGWRPGCASPCSRPSQWAPASCGAPASALASGRSLGTPPAA